MREIYEKFHRWRLGKRNLGKIKAERIFRSAFTRSIRSLLIGSTHGAGAGAGAALDAGISVDHILGVASADSANGTNALASAAHDAGIRNLVSHIRTSINLPGDPGAISSQILYHGIAGLQGGSV